MARLAQDIALIVLVSLALACGSYLARPNAVPLAGDELEIDLAAAQAMPHPLWVDARAREAFEQGTFNGAISVTMEDWEGGFAAALESWQPGQSIIVFCDTGACLRSREVAERLRRELGTDDAYALRDGWQALAEAGLVQEARR